MKSSLYRELMSPLEQTVMAVASALYDPDLLASTTLTEVRDAISDGQLISKDVVLMKLETTHFRKGLVVGGWFGLLANMIALYHDKPVDSLDLDERATNVASRVLGNRGAAIQGDAYSFSYKGYDLVVNTSTEHFTRPISDWIKNLQKGTTVILQNNSDSSIPDHVQCFATHEAFRDSLGLSFVEESLTLEFPQYLRHMVIGRV